MAQQDAFAHRNLSGFPAMPISEPIAPFNMKMDNRHAVTVLAALAHALRLQLWCILLPHGKLGLSAGCIAGKLDIAPSSLSFHLQQMTHAGVLSQRRSNRRIIYAVNAEIIDALRAFLASPLG
jgi:ArsR family transcriptional regulator, arsenate/arsenite/antimonite-responsive transcriptional repressor